MIKIKSDKIIVGESIFDGYVYIENGRITEVTQEEKPVEKEYDYTGKYVSAGFNGEQNYVNWEMMQNESPFGKKGACKNGIYELPEEFFEKSGGIFEETKYYTNLL